ncbi:MAG: hypothetical protein VYD34_02065 [Verrucomicrobiota bacterium]|nr:hypothetical protein [Verrucomicrobiota bacterium]
MKKIITGMMLVFAVGCGGGHGHDHDHDHGGGSHDHGGGSHGHEAPHDGLLVNVDNEFCHLEFLREPGTKRLQMHVMRFHPKEGPVAFFTEKVEAKAQVGDQNKTLVFLPTELDGVTATQKPTSLYVAQVDWIEEGTSFEVTLGEFSIEGKKLTDITFKFPAK